MSLLEAIGERESAQQSRTVVPESRYIMRLSVEGADVTEATENSPGGTPYVDLNGTVLAGPFEGTDINRRLYITPGRVKEGKRGLYGGGFLGFIAGITRKITGKPAEEAAFAQAGFQAPAREQGEGDRDYGFRLRLAIAQFFETLEPAERLKLMLQFTRMAEWDGKTVVAEVNLEEDQFTNDDGEQVTYYKNSWGGFTTLDDSKHGKAFVMAVEHPKQQAAIDEAAAGQDN